MEKAIRRYWPIFVLPTFLAFILGFIAPFVMGVYLSFCKFTTVTDAKFIGFSNYLKIFTDASFVHALWYTALFTVVTVVLINVLAFAVALLLTKGFKGTNIFRTVFFMPNLIGGIILGYIWQLLLNGVLLYMNRTLTYSSVYGFCANVDRKHAKIFICYFVILDVVVSPGTILIEDSFAKCKFAGSIFTGLTGQQSRMRTDGIFQQNEDPACAGNDAGRKLQYHRNRCPSVLWIGTVFFQTV